MEQISLASSGFEKFGRTTKLSAFSGGYGLGGSVVSAVQVDCAGVPAERNWLTTGCT